MIGYIENDVSVNFMKNCSNIICELDRSSNLFFNSIAATKNSSEYNG